MNHKAKRLVQLKIVVLETDQSVFIYSPQYVSVIRPLEDLPNL
jgi:hypothetical protein